MVHRPTPLQSVSLRLQPTLIEKIDAIAEKQNWSRSYTIHRLLEMVVDRPHLHPGAKPMSIAE